MPQRNVTLNFPDEFLKRLDRWAAGKKIKRNAAIMLLWNIVEQNGLVRLAEEREQDGTSS